MCAFVVMPFGLKGAGDGLHACLRGQPPPHTRKLANLAMMVILMCPPCSLAAPLIYGLLLGLILMFVTGGLFFMYKAGWLGDLSTLVTVSNYTSALTQQAEEDEQRKQSERQPAAAEPRELRCFHDAAYCTTCRRYHACRRYYRTHAGAMAIL